MASLANLPGQPKASNHAVQILSLHNASQLPLNRTTLRIAARTRLLELHYNPIQIPFLGLSPIGHIPEGRLFGTVQAPLFFSRRWRELAIEAVRYGLGKVLIVHVFLVNNHSPRLPTTQCFNGRTEADCLVKVLIWFELRFRYPFPL